MLRTSCVPAVAPGDAAIEPRRGALRGRGDDLVVGPCPPIVGERLADATLRRARPADAPAVAAFLAALSPRSRRLRFHGACSGTSPTLLRLLCEVDGLRHQAWFAWARVGGIETVVGEARFARDRHGDAAELALVVADAWQGGGLARALMQRLLQAAAAAGVGELYGDVMDGNARMQTFLARHGFQPGPHGPEDVIRMRRRLCLAAAPARALSRAHGWLRAATTQFAAIPPTATLSLHP